MPYCSLAQEAACTDRPVVVGEPLPSQVEVYEVPGHSDYRYTVLNNKRYVVEQRTRRVVRVID